MVGDDDGLETTLLRTGIFTSASGEERRGVAHIPNQNQDIYPTKHKTYTQANTRHISNQKTSQIKRGDKRKLFMKIRELELAFKESCNADMGHDQQL